MNGVEKTDTTDQSVKVSKRKSKSRKQSQQQRQQQQDIKHKNCIHEQNQQQSQNGHGRENQRLENSLDMEHNRNHDQLNHIPNDDCKMKTGKILNNFSITAIGGSESNGLVNISNNKCSNLLIDTGDDACSVSNKIGQPLHYQHYRKNTRKNGCIRNHVIDHQAGDVDEVEIAKLSSMARTETTKRKANTNTGEDTDTTEELLNNCTINSISNSLQCATIESPESGGSATVPIVELNSQLHMPGTNGEHSNITNNFIVNNTFSSTKPNTGDRESSPTRLHKKKSKHSKTTSYVIVDINGTVIKNSNLNSNKNNNNNNNNNTGPCAHNNSLIIDYCNRKLVSECDRMEPFLDESQIHTPGDVKNPIIDGEADRDVHLVVRGMKMKISTENTALSCSSNYIEKHEGVVDSPANLSLQNNSSSTCTSNMDNDLEEESADSDPVEINGHCRGSDSSSAETSNSVVLDYSLPKKNSLVDDGHKLKVQMKEDASHTEEINSKKCPSITSSFEETFPEQAVVNGSIPCRISITNDIVIEYKEYESELQMKHIMRLIQNELSEPYSIYTFRYFINNWPKLCFLAAHDNEYVGAIVCKLDMHLNFKRGYIAMLAVKKEYRKLKIGTNLVQKAIEAMLADDAAEVVLETEMKNIPALRLYENLGFVRDKRLFRYYLNGVDALRLKLWFR